MAVKYLNKPFFLSALICIFIFYSGLFQIPEHNRFYSLANNYEITEVSGKILSSPAKCQNGKYYNANFEVNQITDKRGMISSSNGRICMYIPSELVEAYFPGKLYSSAKNKGANLYEAGGNYSFSGRFSTNGFYADSCKSAFWTSDLFGKIDYFRALCRLQFKRLMYSWGAAGGLLLALLAGAKEYTESSTAEAFKNAGLSHILALSGMHLSMFSSIAMYFGKILSRKKISFIIRIIALILFVWFAGLSPSLLRAFICAILTIVATMTGTKQPDMIMILCFSFLIQCTISPNDIHNVGFILSYGALAGILLTNRFFSYLYSKIFPRYISSSLSASTGAQIFTAPISLKIFGSFCPIGIIATTIVSPIVTIFIYSGLILIVLCLIFPIFQGPSAIFVNFEYTILSFAVKIFSHAPKWSIN